MGPAVVNLMPHSDRISVQLSRGAELLGAVSMMREDGRAESGGKEDTGSWPSKRIKLLSYTSRGARPHTISCNPRTSYEAVLLLCEVQLRIDCFVYKAGAIIPYATRRNCLLELVTPPP